jgi:Ca2+-binding EF-hand superfamily protein
MNNISLKKLSITVVVASLASNIAFANNDISKVMPKVEKSSLSFSQLVASYDADKNNTLSANELAKNDKLSKVFAKVDANGDKQISEQEFNQYLDSLKKSLS